MTYFQDFVVTTVRSKPQQATVTNSRWGLGPPSGIPEPGYVVEWYQTGRAIGKEEQLLCHAV